MSTRYRLTGAARSAGRTRCIWKRRRARLGSRVEARCALRKRRGVHSRGSVGRALLPRTQGHSEVLVRKRCVPPPAAQDGKRCHQCRNTVSSLQARIAQRHYNLQGGDRSSSQADTAMHRAGFCHGIYPRFYRGAWLGIWLHSFRLVREGCPGRSAGAQQGVGPPSSLDLRES